MKFRFFLWISLAVVGLAFFYQLIRVPVMQGMVWMSPDETANAVSAMNFAQKFSFKLPWGLADQFSWAYPRSFVPLAGQAAIVPVGFLGMPLILGLAFKIFGLFGILFFTPFLVMATLWALFDSLPKKWPLAVRLFGLAIWISFPTVILYANRGSFAQLVIVCLVIWIWWLIGRNKGDFNYLAYLCAGLLTGLVAVIRPVELIWVIPVAVCSYFYHHESKDWKTGFKIKSVLGFSIPFILVCLFGALIGYKTYGQWFVSGYQIRLPASQVSGLVAQTSAQTSVSVLDVVPFEFHPRNILWNIKNFYGLFLWPFALVLLIAIGVWFYEHHKLKTPLIKGFGRELSRNGDRGGFAILALAWTSLFVLFFYGNGLYQDYFVSRVSMGNSFLRYTLPLSVVISIATAYIISKLWKHWSLKVLGVCLAVALIAFGQWSATTRDDEGLSFIETQIARYTMIRLRVQSLLLPLDAIISERSDKIFFPAFAGVSPLPEKQSIKQMVDAGKKVAVFIRTQDQNGFDEWSAAGLPLEYKFTSGNESFYLIKHGTNP